jgi:hypothetical protein
VILGSGSVRSAVSSFFLVESWRPSHLVQRTPGISNRSDSRNAVITPVQFRVSLAACCIFVIRFLLILLIVTRFGVVLIRVVAMYSVSVYRVSQLAHSPRAHSLQSAFASLTQATMKDSNSHFSVVRSHCGSCAVELSKS